MLHFPLPLMNRLNKTESTIIGFLVNSLLPKDPIIHNLFTCLCTSICCLTISLCMFKHMYINTHVCLHICMFTPMYVYPCVYYTCRESDGSSGSKQAYKSKFGKIKSMEYYLNLRQQTERRTTGTTYSDDEEEGPNELAPPTLAAAGSSSSGGSGGAVAAKGKSKSFLSKLRKVGF